MGKYLKSWEWKRLLSKSAWQKVGIGQFIFKLICPVMAVYACLGLKVSETVETASLWEVNFLNVFCAVLVFCFFLAIWEDISQICMAEDAFKIMYEGKEAYLFVYRKTPLHERDFYEIVIVCGKKKVYRNFVIDYFTIGHDRKSRCVIFEENISNSWFIAHEQGVDELGIKIQKNVFFKPQFEEGVEDAKLCIITANGYQIVNVDYFVDNNNLFIPQGALMGAKPLEGSLFVDNKFKKMLPDEYLLIKTKGEYHFLGIYFSGKAKQEPFFLEMQIENAIFREGLSTIVLSCDSLKNTGKYNVLHRKSALSYYFGGDKVIEITNEEKIEGKFYFCDYGDLKPVYEGGFVFIDFVHRRVLGKDNHFYS